ncbi:hypothetical protein [Candidatus Protochlamydia phocaeensis]|uniref:hypothetical protein n=1 Tax=Candidatus Protochlamydia phocaeensis TaxID=1414722 RepID=UPI000838FC89|nr:hypothetical protein [Candidatus Protochlamydia phocaeensis]
MIQNGNLQFFISTVKGIEERIKQTEKAIRTCKSTTDELDIDFQAIVCKTDQLIHLEDTRKPLLSITQSADRLVKLINLKKKINLISKHIHQVNASQKSVKQPPCSVLNLETGKKVSVSLNACINELTQQMKVGARLPCNADKAWEAFYQKKVRDLRLDSSTITTVQKDLFHLMANQFVRKDLQEVDVEAYEGSLELQSAISYLSLLEALRSKIESERLAAFNATYEALKKAEKFAIKTSFAHQVLKKEEKIPLTYLKELVGFDKDSFYSTYPLLSPFSVPFQVLVNDMCWDMIEIIDQMKEGDKRIFNLGTGTHNIVIQIELLPSQQSTDCRYCYTIFNTGNGIKKYHRIQRVNREIFVHPYIIKEVRREKLSYSFIESLILCALDKRSSIDHFYSLHKKFLFEEGKEPDLKSGPLYKAQRFDTCAYSCLEVWIDLQLTEKEILEKETIKVNRYIEMQQQIIELQKEQI